MAENFDPYHVWLAIPPADQPPNHYRLLGVPLFEDNVETIEQAADQRMGHLRNLQTGKHAALSQKLLNEVAKARVCLLNPEKKAAYDQQLREQLGAQRLPSVQEPPVVVTDRNPAPRYTKRASSGGVSPSRWLMPGGIGAAALVALALIAWAMQGPRDRVARDVPPAPPAVPSPDRAPGPGNPHERASTPTDDGPSSSGGSASETSEKQPESPPSGNAEAPPAAEPTQDDDPESDVDEQPSESPTPGEKQSDRHPVPPGSAQKTILAQVNQAFSIGEARQPAEKLELAGKLAALAEKSQKPEERFVLLRRAADLACDGGDAALMLDVVEQIAEQYEVDLLHAQQVMLLRFADAASGKEQIAALVAASESVVDQLVADQRIELADDLSAAVYRATLKQGNTDVRKAALARRREVQHLRDSIKRIEEARATLNANPDDAEAHAALGRWHAFEQGDWKEGLRHLAKGDDSALKRLAEQELAFPQEVAALVALADGWWEAAGKSSDDVKPLLLSRAAYWYRQAEPELTSVVAKAKAAKRLKEIGAAPAAAGPPPAVAPFDAKEAKGHQLRWARHLKVPVEWENSIGMKFVLIPPGEFMMGSTEEEVLQLAQEGKRDNASRIYMKDLLSETPQHRVQITRPFWLGITEVTQAQYQHIMGNNPSKFQGEGQRPVEQVSWNDCVDFCRRLSELPEEKAARRHYGLPTEAQWEYACRAGNPGRRWFSAEPKALRNAVEEKLLGQCAWFNVNAGGKPHPVGQLRSNPWGLHDVYGNVWEWCQDWYGSDYYAESPTSDPDGPATGSNRVQRGGAWHIDQWYCRSANRIQYTPARRVSGLGFRAAASVVCQDDGSTPDATTYRGLIQQALLFYSFDRGTFIPRGSQVLVEDQSGNDHHGRALGTRLVQGRMGEALYFGGGEIRVELGDILNDIKLPVSVSAWCLLNATDQNKRVLLKTDHWESGRLYAGCCLSVTPTARLVHFRFEWGSASGGSRRYRRSAHVEIVIDPKRWIHVVGVARPDRTFAVYIDGEPVSASLSGDARTMSHSSASGCIGLGGNAVIDEVGIWDRELTANEVKTLFRR